MKVAIIALAFFSAAVLASPLVKRQISHNFAYQLPDGVELLVSGLKTSFSCGGKAYGYFADVDNNCQIFHICLPVVDPENNLNDVLQYSFVCGNQTVFDQANLVCTHATDAPDCGASAQLADKVNAEFGKLGARP